MIEIAANRFAKNLQPLFDENQPNSPMLFSVLEGHNLGRALVDDAANPTWCVLQVVEGPTFIGGKPCLQSLAQAIVELRKENEVYLWQGNKQSQIFPTPNAKLARLEFYDLETSNDTFETLLQKVPFDCEVRRMNRQIIKRCLWRDMHASACGSIEDFLAKGLGFCLMKGDEILCEAYATFWGGGKVEIGAITRKPYRGLGYASVTCAHLILACEERDYQTYWSCRKDNVASASVARKLGYKYENEYLILVYEAIKEPV